MRVVHFIPSLCLDLGGLVRHVIDVANVLSSIGVSVVVATCDDRDAPEEWRHDGATADPQSPRLVRLGRARLPTPWLHTNACREMRDLIDWADVLHMHVVWHPTSIQLTRLATRRNTPSVIMVHGMLDEWCMAQKPIRKRLYLNTVGRRMLRRSSGVLCATETERRQAMGSVPGIPMRVVPGILDIEPFLTASKNSRSEHDWASFGENAGETPRVLFLSRFHHKKNIEALIDAAGVLRERGTRVRVLIVGSGEAAYTNHLRDRIAENGLGDVVKLHPPVYGEDKAALYASADLFVLPTRQENFGLVLFEALASGTPVVTTKGVGTWQELQESGGVTLVEGGAETLADAITHVLSDREALAAMGEAGRRWVVRECAPTRIGERYRSMYKDVAAR